MRNRYVFLADVTAIALAAWGAFAFRFGWFFISDRPEFPLFLGIAILVKVLVFYAFGLYQRYWRYATFWDLMAVALANAAASLLFAVAIVGIRLTGVIQSLSRSVLPSICCSPPPNRRSARPSHHGRDRRCDLRAPTATRARRRRRRRRRPRGPRDGAEPAQG